MHLTVIAKQPLPGMVKTRLCPPCTEQQAAEIAAAALLDTLDAVDALVATIGTKATIERVLLFDGDPTDWTRPGYTNLAQRGDGLGERLANAFDDLGHGMIVGMEAPLAVPTMSQAVAALGRGCDALGLAVDGGYWAIGLHAIDADVFDGVPMSSSHTGLAQLSRLHALGRAVRMLPMSHDLDTADDLRIAARRQPNTRLAAVARIVIDGI